MRLILDEIVWQNIYTFAIFLELEDPLKIVLFLILSYFGYDILVSLVVVKKIIIHKFKVTQNKNKILLCFNFKHMANFKAFL